MMKEFKESGWPQWPQVTEKTEECVKKCLKSNRWAISGYWNEQPCREQLFAKKFAEYNKVEYCVPTTNGSSALQIALEALGVGFGDEVIMPALTWIATATAILKVNALPIFVDSDKNTYCMDASKIEATITEKTKAIVVVHLMCCMVNMDEVMRISQKYNIPVIEDCAQAHGMMWNNHRAGSIGDIGAFSFQQGKILTSGEGGATITKNLEYFLKLEQLRSDSRKFIRESTDLTAGDMELESEGAIQGYNHCMSEFQAAILMEQMEQLDEFNQKKIENAAYITQHIAEIKGFDTIRIPKEVNYQTFYGYVLKVDKKYFGEDINCDDIVVAIRRRLNIGSFFVHTMYKAVHKNEIFCPWTSSKYCKEIVKDEAYWRTQSYPIAESANSSVIILHHSMLLARKEKLDELLAVLKELSETKRA